jgi:hypothetical protein
MIPIQYVAAFFVIGLWNIPDGILSLLYSSHSELECEHELWYWQLGRVIRVLVGVMALIAAILGWLA